MFSKFGLVAGIIVLFVFSGTLLLQRCGTKETKASVEQTGNNEFIGDQSCKNCHASEHTAWLQSDHFKAMQPAGDSTVTGSNCHRPQSGKILFSRIAVK